MVPVRGIGSEGCAQAQLCTREQRRSSWPHDHQATLPSRLGPALGWGPREPYGQAGNQGTALPWLPTLTVILLTC